MNRTVEILEDMYDIAQVQLKNRQVWGGQTIVCVARYYR